MTRNLNRAPNLHDADGFYAAFVAAHEGLPDAASELLNARLVLILANHIGDPAVLDEALRLARAPLAAKTGATTEPSR
jgi:hypothetical protein